MTNTLETQRPNQPQPSSPINHHFVPKHVLRRFCDPQGVLWTYDKETKQISKGRPRSQGSADHFYSFESHAGKDNETIELKFLGKIDNDGSVAIASLLRHEYLTTERARGFMRFAAAQMLRVDTYFERLKNTFSPIFQEMAERMVKYDEGFRTGLLEDLRKSGGDETEIQNFLAALERGEFKMTASRDFIVTTFLEMLDVITAKFCQMKWCYLRTKDPSEVFVISDNPLVLEDVGKGDAQPLGILNPNIEIVMPLDPTTVAVARWDGETSYGTVMSDSVAIINQRIIDRAHRYVYAPYRSEELLARVVASQGRQARTYVEKIQQGGGLIMKTVYSG
jgi:hypothetical protein